MARADRGAERSGQSVAAFCRERGFAASQFYAWRKRLRRLATPNSSWKCKSSKPEAAPPPAQAGRIEIRLSGRALCSWWSLASTPEHLRAVVAALESER